MEDDHPLRYKLARLSSARHPFLMGFRKKSRAIEGGATPPEGVADRNGASRHLHFTALVTALGSLTVGGGAGVGRAASRRRSLPALGWVSLVALSLSACGDDGTAPRATRINLSPEEVLLVRLGETKTFRVNATDAEGGRVTGAAQWAVTDESVASVNQSGRVQAVGPGVASVTATLGGITGSARVEVYIPEAVDAYEPGESYWGRRSYTEYIPGELPLVLSAGHGGDLRPGEIATRTYGTTAADSNTRELTMELRAAFIELSGFAPHTVISHLHRSRLDPNREIVEAAQGNIYAQHAWDEYHELIRLARRRVELDFGSGFYIDMHGHGHTIQRLELGYLLTAEELNGSDESLDQLATVARSSIRDLGRDSPLPFSALLRGPTSLGGLLEGWDIPVVPAPSDPSPGSDPYWRGGYSTRLHGSVEDGEVVSGVQIEHHWDDLRDSANNRATYARQLARSVRAFMLEHYGFFEPSEYADDGERGR